jgi:asparagine synthase (glutamine-hydrolysing)
VSGIGGVIRLDGARGSAMVAAAMSGAQRHRGGDQTGVHADGPATLAATLRHTTPESLREVQPLAGESGLWLVADARIDNRAELIASLGRRARPAPTDADLILAAYERWAEGSPARLVGDYAFAIWDADARRLFCARDALGLRPFCYVHQPGRSFAFASESKALFAVPEVARRINETSVLAYLDGRDAPVEETFFEGVRRLAPGHHLTLDPSGLRIERYWSLDPDKEIEMARPGDYVDAFRAAFDEAVADRTRSIHPVGTMLSGGLDSSAITSTARGLSVGQDLATFSFTFDSVPESDERRYQELVNASGGFRRFEVAGDELDPFLDFDQILHHADEPTGAGNLFLNWAAWHQARAAGTTVLLDGFFGDSAVSYGDDRLAELVRAGRLWAWAREVRARREVEGGGRRMVANLIASSLRAGLPQWPRSGTKDFIASPTAPVFVPLAPSAAGRLPARPPDTDSIGFRTVRQRQLEDVSHEAYTPIFEVMNKVSAGAGVDVRFPFADRRLIELCVALPSALKQRDGWDRWVLRAALRGRVPEPVRWRTGKADLLPNLARALRGRGRARLADELDDNTSPLARFVDRHALREQVRRLDAGETAPAPALWTAACASAWLRAQGASASLQPDQDSAFRPPAQA